VIIFCAAARNINFSVERIFQRIAMPFIYTGLEEHSRYAKKKVFAFACPRSLPLCSSRVEGGELGVLPARFAL
jgi:hypothetical protein